MLSYRHLFHAGNAADAFKHTALCAVLDAINAKAKPALYLDTHAGSGLYDLNLDAARQAREFDAGIGTLWAGDATGAPAPILRYLDCVRAENPDGALRHYPGACRIAARLLAPQHRLLLCELHPRDHARLTRTFTRHSNARVLCEDGYARLKADLPPSESRALAFIDPAYELREEPTRLIEALAAAFQRFAHGVYMIWYPLTGKVDHVRLLREFVRLDPPKTLRLELQPHVHAAGAVASGLLIVNPPFTAIASLTEALDYLKRALATPGTSKCDWLVPEDR